MQDKKTDDLRQELMNAPNIETYLQNNRIALARITGSLWRSGALPSC